MLPDGIVQEVESSLLLLEQQAEEDCINFVADAEIAIRISYIL
jgi:hypothetical protein